LAYAEARKTVEKLGMKIMAKENIKTVWNEDL